MRVAGVHRGARAAGPALPPVPREAHVPLRNLLPQQTLLRVHRVGARPLFPRVEAEARPQTPGAYRWFTFGFSLVTQIII